MFTEKFLPVANVGDRVVLMTNTGKYLANVVWVEPIPLIQVVTDTITAGSTLEREMKELYVEDNEFAQYRMKIETANVELVTHKAPEAGTYYATKNVTGIIPDASKYTDNAVSYYQLTEFYQFQDLTRKMIFKNSGSSDTAATIDFYGYVYVFDNVQEIKDLSGISGQYIAVPCVSKNARA